MIISDMMQFVWLLWSGLVIGITQAQVPCIEVHPQLDLPCLCIAEQNQTNIKINCDNVAFSKDFPLLPFQ